MQMLRPRNVFLLAFSHSEFNEQINFIILAFADRYAQITRRHILPLEIDCRVSLPASSNSQLY